jgi:ribonuclease HI
VAVESIEHCLFLCVDAVVVWRACGLYQLPNTTQGISSFDWCKKYGKIYGNIIFVTMWFVWCARNDFVFNNHKASVITTVHKIQSMLSSCVAAFGGPAATLSPDANRRLVAWSRPDEGTVCLNVDGSLLDSANTAGYGGLLRNNNGEFLWGFYGVAAIQSVLFAEIMAILHGLQFCWDSGYRKVICFSDSLQSVNLIRDGVSAHHRFANEIYSIRTLLAKDWNVMINHTLREGNACADVMAKMGALSNSHLVKIDTPPQKLLRPLSADAQGVVFIRE